jgi:glycosyltransferase involved in cell wall biosynthesis
MARWLRAERAQVVHSYNAFANAWGYLAARAAGVPVYVAGERGTVWNTQPIPVRWLDHRALQVADAVAANSAASATMVHLRHGVPRDRIHVVHNAVSPLPPADVAQLRAELGLPSAAIVVGSIGRLDTPKGFHVFVEAAALVLQERPETRFVLVGDGPLRSTLESQVRALGISERFTMTGWRDDARQLIQAFDLFVSTSIRESFGNVLVEAGLAGIPSIAPSIDGIPEVIVDGLNGILLTPTEPARQPALGQRLPDRVLIDGRLVPPREISAHVLAETILGLVADTDLRARYGQAAHERAKTLFSMDRYIAEIEALYAHLAARTLG